MTFQEFDDLMDALVEAEGRSREGLRAMLYWERECSDIRKALVAAAREVMPAATKAEGSSDD